MNLRKCDAAAITALVVFLAGSHIFANQAFAISAITKIIDSVVVGPCTQEDGHFMYLICGKLDPSLLINGAALKSLLLSDKNVVNEMPVLKSLLMGNGTGFKNLLLHNATALKSSLLNNATASK